MILLIVTVKRKDIVYRALNCTIRNRPVVLTENLSLKGGLSGVIFMSIGHQMESVAYFYFKFYILAILQVINSKS